MQRYREFQPTSYDGPGLNGDSLGIADWFVLAIMRTRDSGPLDESNFRVALRELGGESDTVQIHRFGHWGPGWFEIIVIDPTDTARVDIAEELESSLADYPILDESDYSDVEYTRACEYWSRASVRDRVYWCQRYDVSIFAARREEIPEDPRGELVSALAE